MHGTYDSQLIALPFMFGCGVRVIKSASKCVAFLSLKWRVKGGPRFVDMPGAQWSISRSRLPFWHYYLKFLTWALNFTHQIFSLLLLYYTAHDDVIYIFRVTAPLWGESPSHRWIPLTGASDAELWRFLFCFFCFWPSPQQTVKQTMETPVIWDAIALIMMSLQCFLWNWNWFHLLVSIHCLLMVPIQIAL